MKKNLERELELSEKYKLKEICVCLKVKINRLISSLLEHFKQKTKPLFQQVQFCVKKRCSSIGGLQESTSVIHPVSVLSQSKAPSTLCSGLKSPPFSDYVQVTASSFSAALFYSSALPHLELVRMALSQGLCVQQSFFLGRVAFSYLHGQSPPHSGLDSDVVFSVRPSLIFY